METTQDLILNYVLSLSQKIQDCRSKIKECGTLSPSKVKYYCDIEYYKEVRESLLDNTDWGKTNE